MSPRLGGVNRSDSDHTGPRGAQPDNAHRERDRADEEPRERLAGERTTEVGERVAGDGIPELVGEPPRGVPEHVAGDADEERACPDVDPAEEEAHPERGEALDGDQMAHRKDDGRQKKCEPGAAGEKRAERETSKQDLLHDERDQDRQRDGDRFAPVVPFEERGHGLRDRGEVEEPVADLGENARAEDRQRERGERLPGSSVRGWTLGTAR